MPPPEGLAQFDLTGIDPHQQLVELDRSQFEDSLYDFLKAAWRFMDPNPWKDGWHIEAIAEHLQAVVDGQIRRLIINVPPRHGKSLITSVAFPAWTWAQSERTPTSGPGVAFLYASYADRLSLRDSVKCRRLIESPWFQGLWGSRFQLTGDNNTKSRFGNSIGGERLITSIGAGVTGEGGNIIVIDDPGAANEVASEATTETMLNWWTTAMSTRLNDPETGAYVIIQQRLAQNDLTGHIQEHEADDGWTQLILPGRYEADRKYFTELGWTDPRTKEGELLWPERFSEKSLEELERKMGPWVFAGQIQQRPEPKGGGIIKRSWWQLWDEPKYPPLDFILATLDTAYTSSQENDPSAMIVWGIFHEDGAAQATRMLDETGRPMYIDRTYSTGAPKLIMLEAWTDRLELHDLIEKVAEVAKRREVNTLQIENKASGISVAQEIRRLYSSAKFSVQLFDPKSQDKMARLYSVQHLFAEGMVYAPERPWANAVIDQCGIFPKGAHDDLVDCVSMGLRTLREMGLLQRAVEHRDELESLKIYPGGQSAALYEC